jgi:hypothetical protein
MCAYCLFLAAGSRCPWPSESIPDHIFGALLAKKQDISKQTLIQTVTPAIKQAFTAKNIQAGFRNAGLNPLTAEPILAKLKRHRARVEAAKQLKEQSREQHERAEKAESKSDVQDGKGDVEMAPADAKTANDKAVRQVLAVPEEKKKRKRGGRRQRFPNGAELTATHVMDAIEKQQQQAKAKGRKSKKAQTAFLVNPQNGQIYGSGPAESKRTPPARKKRRVVAPSSTASSSDADSESSESSESEAESERDKDTSEDESAVDQMEEQFQGEEKEQKEEEQASSGRDSEDDSEMCAMCARELPSGYRRVACRGSCKLLFHFECTGLPPSKRFESNPEFHCLACRPAAPRANGK